ncbi:uncharacterized protein EAF01_009103 [Botrytis porri]|uniref:Uncharacterized protein n=1 Tax=Botrytis porri TaxID=87229 RepID=A0A4Z1KJ29_9HELO|nr:uncharacterized protein EAF01_009103 [Botrytis porri]KAF7896700.1 hypothetical protein EAF01_009103 [Botrytis porri]TGO85578.1 hypothetical protein BPOR_0383g00040 [Botrytis porri]
MPPVEKDHDLIPMAPPKSPESPLEDYAEISSEISVFIYANSSLSINKSTQQIPNQEKKSVVDILPAELIANIMGHLGPTFGVIFGLTCHRVYDEYKRQYPHSDALLLETRLWDNNSKEDVQHPLYRPSARLHELLDGWMGSDDTTKYFYFRDLALGSSDILIYCAIPGYYVGKFLLRDIYGEEADPSGHALRQLLLAWCACVHIQRGWLQFRGDDEHPQYPSPLNMGGKAWIDEMVRIVNVYKNREPEDIFIYIVRVAINVANKEYGQGSLLIEARRKQLREQQKRLRE